MANSAGRLIGELFAPALMLIDELSKATDESEAADIFGCDKNRYWFFVGKALSAANLDSLPESDLADSVRTIQAIYEGTRTQCNTFSDVAGYLFQRRNALRQAARRGWSAAKQGGTIPEDPFPASLGYLKREPAGSDCTGLSPDKSADATFMLPEVGTTTHDSTLRGENDPNNVDTSIYNRLDTLQPSAANAYVSFTLAEARAQRRLEDREAWEDLKEHGVGDDKTDCLADYKLPGFQTWCRYLRLARKALNERKYTPRTGRKLRN